MLGFSDSLLRRHFRNQVLHYTWAVALQMVRSGFHGEDSLAVFRLDQEKNRTPRMSLHLHAASDESSIKCKTPSYLARLIIT